jgi:DNA-binding MarR family transcriptional regulator
MKDSSNHDPAMRLAMAVKRLHARMREVTYASAPGLSISQLTILKHLRDSGPATASALAVAEHVSQQAIAQNLAALKEAGLVRATPDQTDRRKSLISITKGGLKLFEAAIASRNAWLIQAIETEISSRELPALEKAIELLERLAATDTSRKIT